MRDIKFRGKDLETGKWVYGDLLQYNEGGVAIGIHGTFIDDGYHFNEWWDRCPIVDDETVGQFTGLRDNNGKEIYEGDILEIINQTTGNRNLYCVEWNKKGYYQIDLGNVGKTIIGYINTTDIRLLGNIHDNPDLLENYDSE